MWSNVALNPNSTNPTGFQPQKKFNPVENVGWIPENFQSGLKIFGDSTMGWNPKIKLGWTFFINLVEDCNPNFSTLNNPTRLKSTTLVRCKIELFKICIYLWMWFAENRASSKNDNFSNVHKFYFLTTYFYAYVFWLLNFSRITYPLYAQL